MSFRTAIESGPAAVTLAYGPAFCLGQAATTSCTLIFSLLNSVTEADVVYHWMGYRGSLMGTKQPVTFMEHWSLPSIPPETL